MTKQLPEIEPLTPQERKLVLLMVETGIKSAIVELSVHRGYAKNDTKQRKWLRDFCHELLNEEFGHE